MTIAELIIKLHRFPMDMNVYFRKAEKDGYTSDWELHNPEEFYPGGSVYLSIYKQAEYQNKEIK